MRLLKVDDVAEILGMHPQTVYRMARQGKIPSVKIGRSLRFDSEEIEEWIKGRKERKRRGRKASMDFPIG